MEFCERPNACTVDNAMMQRVTMKNTIIIFVCAIFLVGCSVTPIATLEEFAQVQSTPTGQKTAQVQSTHAANDTTGDNRFDFFSNNTCDVPCFLGITPGVTSEGEAKAIISSSSMLLNCEEEHFEPTTIGYKIRCTGVSFWVAKNSVTMITITPQPTIVEQIILKYGAPNEVNTVVSSLPDYPFRSIASLIYDQLHIEITLFEIDGLEYTITSSAEVRWITIWAEGERVINSDFVPWRGYGVYTSHPD
jgi:hypothetical protein